jgi:hypothetical protein
VEFLSDSLHLYYTRGGAISEAPPASETAVFSGFSSAATAPSGELPAKGLAGP